MRIAHVTAWSTFVLLAVHVAGCGGSLPATVSGRVTLDGQPATRGGVVFYPVAGGPIAPGDIQADGSYTLKTGNTAGLTPGEYQVTVLYRRGMPSIDMTPAQVNALDLVPSRYRSKETTPLRFAIAPGHNTIDLPIQSEPAK